MSSRRHPLRLSKAQSYMNRVATVEYDLHGMIEAYGLQFVHWLADEIASGRVNCKQDVDRWAAHVHIYKNKNFAAHQANYGEAIDDAMFNVKVA